MSDLQTLEQIAGKIMTVRGQRVMIDTDLAALYGVSTKALNQAVKRNSMRFPDDFMFQLAATEKEELVAICAHLGKLKHSRTLPFAFTEHGAIQAANVLNSPQAADIGVSVVRAFVRLRQTLASHADLSQRLTAMEKNYDAQFKTLFAAVREILALKESSGKRPIGFGPWNEQ